ncbi:MAG: hypothetical protein PVI26_09975 [Chitinispirillia bacterium]
MLYKIFLKILLLVTLITSSLFSQEVLSKDFFSTVSTSLLGLSYETVFKKKHGVTFEGNAMYWDKNLSYEIGLHYNNYFDKKSMKWKKSGNIIGTKLQNWGPSIKFLSTESTFRDEDKNKYDYSVQYLCIGLHYGKKRVFNPGITVDTRIGYGVPIEITEFKWKYTRPDQNAKLLEKLTHVFSGLDFGVYIGYSF